MMSTVPHDILLGRWRLTLDLFGRVFVDDVGLEPGSIISELGGFPVKEAKFRREMEKLRNSRTVDLTLSKLDRYGNLLVQNFTTRWQSPNSQLILCISQILAPSLRGFSWVRKVNKRNLVANLCIKLIFCFFSL